MVNIIGKNGESLMPTNRHGKVRRMLRDGLAIVVCKNPFTIQLLYTTTNHTQTIDVGIDLGYKHIGFALVANAKVIEKGEIELRQDVSSLLTLRATLRKSRRARNTRYRKPRFNNRKRKDGWLAPSTQSKYNHILRHINRLTKHLHAYRLHVEIANFDIAKINQPEIEGVLYQKGNLYGYENMKQYLLARENATCQFCKKKKNDKWHIHHTVPRSQGGTDKPDNLALVHESCHSYMHKHNMLHKLKAPKQYKDATFMNIIKWLIVNDLKKLHENVSFTFGYITKIDRQSMNLPKTHYNDALAITKQEVVKNNIKPLMIKQMRKKKRSLHEATPRKGRKIPNILALRNAKNTKEVVMFNKVYALCDKVKIDKEIGFITGFTGKSAYVQNIQGEYLSFMAKATSRYHLCA